MAPHVEQFNWDYKKFIADGYKKLSHDCIYKKVPGTEHKTGDTESSKALKAHDLLVLDPINFREVGDSLGPVCEKKYLQTEVAENESSVV